MFHVPAFVPQQQQPKAPEDLKISIQMLIQELEAYPRQTFAITLLSQKYMIKRRRLYDMINVFSAIGCCRKSGLDHMVWMGTEMFSQFLSQMKKSRGIDDKTKTLCDLFPVASCIGISNLTVCFLLLFSALKTNHLDLRFVGQLFSRETSRYKTTLCKLYQISYILSSIHITNRTSTVCEVILLPPYSDEDILPDEPDNKANNSIIPISIDSLLNTHIKIEPENQYIYDRRHELRDTFIECISQSRQTFPIEEPEEE